MTTDTKRNINDIIKDFGEAFAIKDPAKILNLYAEIYSKSSYKSGLDTYYIEQLGDAAHQLAIKALMEVAKLSSMEKEPGYIHNAIQHLGVMAADSGTRETFESAIKSMLDVYAMHPVQNVSNWVERSLDRTIGEIGKSDKAQNVKDGRRGYVRDALESLKELSRNLEAPLEESKAILERLGIKTGENGRKV